MASSSKQGASGLPGRPKGPPPPRRMTIPFAQQTPKPPPHPILKQASYPVYNLKWEKLKAILEKRFPGYTFTRRCDDLDEIAKATDEGPKMPARESQSPE
ncbi:MAG: hypothetical protein L6R42_003867 [Xanthoria sp. 1 TBL-2021]|nr:MAG: hypothetical protein L6R42_003867 [Xanthoria sp. 1 TBL-2021]